ncbi:hypothetical protein BH23ACT9_BH23ACT9_34190 [soil metagenome]
MGPTRTAGPTGGPTARNDVSANRHSQSTPQGCQSTEDARQQGQTDAVAAMSAIDRQAATLVGAGLMAASVPWTVDDLRDRLEPLRLSGSNHCFGGLIAAWSRAGVIRCCGVVESRRRPGCFVRLWIGVSP